MADDMTINNLHGSSLRGPDKLRYPYKCPRCGRAAYIGLSEVDHYDKSKECK